MNMAIVAIKRPLDLDPSRQAATQVFERLRDMIIALQLAPGSVVNRLELQSVFGLSSTPVRDALLRLADEGLVDVIPQSTTRISLIDVTKARQAQFLRRGLEQEVVRQLCALPDQDFLPELRALIGLQKQRAKVGDYEGFNSLDRNFHARMFEAAGVSELFQLVRQRSGHIDRIRRLHLPVAGRMQQIMRDHGLIVKAIASGDAHRAQASVRDHLSRSLAFSSALREKHPTYFKT
jgi:GntR family transcriptional regulator, rspAB operon transcriptional repressor